MAAYHRRERGYVFLRVMLVLQLLGYSVMAAKFLRYSLPMLVLLDLLAAVGIVASVGMAGKQVKGEAAGLRRAGRLRSAGARAVRRAGEGLALLRDEPQRARALARCGRPSVS